MISRCTIVFIELLKCIGYRNSCQRPPIQQRLYICISGGFQHIEGDLAMVFHYIEGDVYGRGAGQSCRIQQC